MTNLLNHLLSITPIVHEIPTPYRQPKPSAHDSVWLLLTIVLAALILGLLPTPLMAKPKTPNILFVIMDDVGMDQMKLYGYGGDQAPSMPSINTIADQGIRFRNAWSMPACSTSRAVFFTGRYPLRTNVLGALGPNDLANAMVSPYELSLPTLLKKSGYQSALFGKFHLGLQGNSPFKESMPASLGWDYFYGWLDETGDPSSIDTTAGNVAKEGESFSCGFVPGAEREHGADSGACYKSDNSCEELVVSASGLPPGRACRDSGGILDPGRACGESTPINILGAFSNLSGHYVSPLYINGEPVDATDIRARTFRGTTVVDAAIDWINAQPKKTPWMASVSFASAHTPMMQPPQALLPSDPDPKATSNLSCDATDDGDQRALTNLMIEALDTEVGRLLVSVGVAKRNKDGSLKYNPKNTDTMVVILGDNGTLAQVVKKPACADCEAFDPQRAKGTAYQTGVWVPLIVAGPLVKSPDREAPQMVNIADLYQLFGELAGIDVVASVPRKLDSKTMLPYLNSSRADSVRKYNFTQVGPNLQADQAVNAPCTIGSACTQIPVSASVCTDNGGIWWGPGAPDPLNKGGFLPTADSPEVLTYCCNVNNYVYHNTKDSSDLKYFNLQPLKASAIRNDNYKLVRNAFKGVSNLGDIDPATAVQESQTNCDDVTSNEFYEIDEGTATDPAPKIDLAELNLMDKHGLKPSNRKLWPVYFDLSRKLHDILNSEVICPKHSNYIVSADGNLDGRIDKHDVDDWRLFAYEYGGGSSWYDIDNDGLTTETDLALILPYLGPPPTFCLPE